MLSKVQCLLIVTVVSLQHSHLHVLRSIQVISSQNYSDNDLLLCGCSSLISWLTSNDFLVNHFGTNDVERIPVIANLSRITLGSCQSLIFARYFSTSPKFLLEVVLLRTSLLLWCGNPHTQQSDSCFLPFTFWRKRTSTSPLMCHFHEVFVYSVGGSI